MDGSIRLQLCNENSDNTGDESSNVSQIMCDPELEIITTSRSKIRKPVNTKVSSALRNWFLNIFLSYD